MFHNWIGGGSGFGLFISKSIVQLHGGTLKAHSGGEGKGCSFMFKVPMTRKKGVPEDPWRMASNNDREGNEHEEYGDRDSKPIDHHANDDKGHDDHHNDHSIQPSLKMPHPTRARALPQHDDNEDDIWSNLRSKYILLTCS